MTWAITDKGRTGRAAILLLLEDRREAESIAIELRARQQRVDVCLYNVNPTLIPDDSLSQAKPSGPPRYSAR
jgi:hypothetical protein